MANTKLCLVLLLVLKTFISLNAQYVATPRSTDNLEAVLKHSFELKCKYTGSHGDGQFTEWYRDNEPVKNEKPGHYVVKTTGKETMLTIKIFVYNDSLVKLWSVKTNKQSPEGSKACEFRQIPLKPTPQGIETEVSSEKLDTAHGSVRRSQDESVTLKCLIEPKRTELNRVNAVKWTYGTDDKIFSDLPTDVNLIDDSQIEIKQVKRSHSGHYRCSLNEVSFTVLLRVKDRLAALWPFLGIVSVVIVLVTIILIFEKRQKATRKAAARGEDENDHTRDPLVRSTAKSSDNENKKSAVKA